MRLRVPITPLLTVFLALITGCAAGASGAGAGSGLAVQPGPFEPRIIARGRSECAISFVESAEGAIDPTGRYLALPGFCPRSSQFGDHVVEIIDLERERSIQAYDYNGSGEGYPFFSADGTLFAFSHIAQEKPEPFPGSGNLANIRIHRWSPPYRAAPEIENFVPRQRELASSPMDLAASPQGERIAFVWLGVGQLGVVQVISTPLHESDILFEISTEELYWPGGSEYFRPVRALWLDDNSLLVSGGVYTEGNQPIVTPANRAGAIIIDLRTGRLLSDPSGGPLTDPNYDKVGYAYHRGDARYHVGMPVQVLPNGLLVLEGGNDGRPPEPNSNLGEYDLQIRSLDNFSFIGGVLKPDLLERTLAGYDFSPDGARAYMLLRDGTLRIYHTRSWELIATLPVRSLGVREATEIVASPNPNQIVLIGDRRWALVELN